MQTILQKAGAFDVESIPCRYYAGPSSLTGPRTGVLHTTEGNFDSSLAEFKQKFAPHFLISDSRIAQLVPIGMSGASLVTHNNAALVQIEVVAYSKEQPWFPDDATAARLAEVLSTCYHLFGIPLSRPFPDGNWGKYGDNPNRHANKWGVEAGWFGHGDVPSPDSHWDPGNLQWSRLFDLAKSLDTPSLQEPDGPVGHAEVAPSPAPLIAAPPLVELPVWPPAGNPFFALAARCLNKWVALGAPVRAAYGLIANAEAECAFNVKAVGDNDSAYGLHQWHWTPRGASILAATGIDVRSEPTVEKHVEAAHWEITHLFAASWAKVIAATTAAEAGSLVCIYYEGAGAAHAPERRAAMAERWLKFFADNPDFLSAHPAQG